MSEQSAKSSPSDRQTLIFMAVLSIVCALILSVLASALSKPIEEAKELDRSKQMMIAAKIMNHYGMLLLDESGKQVFARVDQQGQLTPSDTGEIASRAEIQTVYKKLLVPLLVNDKGELFTFEQLGMNEESYVSQFKKTGYYKQPYKLVYKILPVGEKEANEKDLAGAAGWVFPINGMGLWDAIYGYLAISADGVTVIGITWYDQKETPGLGANISEEGWQSFFPGKKIFQESSDGAIDIKTAPLGIVVVKGKVSEVYGTSAKSKSAVDGMAGATITGNGVTDAYQNVLAPYRPFLERIHSAYEKNKKVSE